VAISRSTWTKSFTFSDDTQLGEVTSLALSANGVYLATASKSGVSIWSTQNRRILIQCVHAAFEELATEEQDRLPHATGDSFVTQLAWSPTQNILAWTDSEGSVVRYPDVIPSVFADPVKLSLASAATATTLKRRKTPDLFGDDLEDEDTKATGPDVDMGGDQDVLGDFLDDDLGDYLKDDNEARFRDGKVEVGALLQSVV
jgi:chromosome transmission fidelity protein 4